MDMMLVKVLSRSWGWAASLLWGNGSDRAKCEEPSKSPKEEEVVGGGSRGDSKEGQPSSAKNSRLQCLMSMLMPVCLGTVVIFMRKNAERLICLFMSVWNHVITKGMSWCQDPVVALPLP